LKQFEYLFIDETDPAFLKLQAEHTPKKNGFFDPEPESTFTFQDYLNGLGKQGWEISSNRFNYLGKREITPDRSNSYDRSSQDMER
jgi:hypothetical protein